MTARNRFDRVRDEVSRLQGIRHPKRPIADAVAHGEGAKLVANQPGVHYGLLYALPQS